MAPIFRQKYEINSISDWSIPINITAGKKLWKYPCLCCGICGDIIYAGKNGIDSSQIPPKSKSPCRSCSMRGKKNRKPKHKTGEERILQGYIFVKQANGKSVHKARIVMSEKLGRPLTSKDRVRFKDHNLLNVTPENLYLESEGMRLENGKLVHIERDANGIPLNYPTPNRKIVPGIE